MAATCFRCRCVPGGDFDPVWSPDGNTIAFTSLRERDITEIFLLNLRDNTVTPLPDPDGKSNSQPAWSPDSKMLAYIGGDGRIWAMAVAPAQTAMRFQWAAATSHQQQSPSGRPTAPP